MEQSNVFAAPAVSFQVGDIAEVSGFVGRIVRLFNNGAEQFASLRPIGRNGGGVTVPGAKLNPVL